MTCKERNKMAETKKEGNYRYRLGKRTYAIRGRRIEGERKKERIGWEESVYWVQWVGWEWWDFERVGWMMIGYWLG